MIGVALAGQILLVLLGVTAGAGPMALLMLFTAALAVPLIIGAVLTPPLTRTPDGLILHPMLGRPRTVPWTRVRALRPYNLLPADEPFVQLLIGKAHMPRRDGRWVIVDGGLPFLYRLAPWLTGLGNVAAFAISDASHADYADLLAALEARIGSTDPAP